MTGRARILALGLLVLAGLAAFLIARYRGDEQAIQRTLRKVCKQASVDGPSTPLEAANRARRLAEGLAPDVALTIAPARMRVEGRAAFRRYAAAAYLRIERLRVSVHDPDVAVDPERRTAVVEATLRFDAVVDGRREKEWQEVAISFEKTEGRWRISRIGPSDSIVRPGAR